MLTKRRPGRPTVDDPGTPSPLGRRIRQARQELGLSLAAVAGDDFSRAFLNQIELGRAQPSTQNLRSSPAGCSGPSITSSKSRETLQPRSSLLSRKPR